MLLRSGLATHGFFVQHVAYDFMCGGGGVAFVIEEVGLRRGAGSCIFVAQGAAGAFVCGVGEAVLRWMRDGLIEEWTPVAECDLNVGVFCLHLLRQ